MKRIHIIGSGPRTGTTLLTEVMHTCFEIDHHCEHEASICTDEPLVGNIFLTKQPGEMAAVKWPLKLNKNLYVICIIRDPRDSIVSKHGLKPDIYWTGLSYWKQFIKIFPKLFIHPRFVYFKYEDFVTDPDLIQKKIKDRIPFLKETYKFSEYHLHAKPSEDSIKALKSVRPITPAGIGRWKRHLPRVKSQIEIHGDISSDLILHGYESTTAWLKCLEDVQSISFDQKIPQFFRRVDRWRRKKRELIEVFNIFVRRFGLDPVCVKRPFQLFFSSLRKILKPLLKPVFKRYFY